MGKTRGLIDLKVIGKDGKEKKSISGENVCFDWVRMEAEENLKYPVIWLTQNIRILEETDYAARYNAIALFDKDLDLNDPLNTPSIAAATLIAGRSTTPAADFIGQRMSNSSTTDRVINKWSWSVQSNKTIKSMALRDHGSGSYYQWNYDLFRDINFRSCAERCIWVALDGRQYRIDTRGEIKEFTLRTSGEYSYISSMSPAVTVSHEIAGCIDKDKKKVMFASVNDTSLRFCEISLESMTITKTANKSLSESIGGSYQYCCLVDENEYLLVTSRGKAVYFKVNGDTITNEKILTFPVYSSNSAIYCGGAKDGIIITNLSFKIRDCSFDSIRFYRFDKESKEIKPFPLAKYSGHYTFYIGSYGADDTMISVVGLTNAFSVRNVAFRGNKYNQIQYVTADNAHPLRSLITQARFPHGANLTAYNLPEPVQLEAGDTLVIEYQVQFNFD